MSSGFTFGVKTTETPAFGQTPVFGSPQPGGLTFGTSVSNATTLPQFTSTFGGGTSTGGFQFSSPTTTSGSTFLPPTFNFNSSAPQSSLKPTGITFGTPVSNSNTNTASPFGLPSTSQTQNLFATSASSVPSSGLTFGTSKPTLPGTGLTFNSQTLTTPSTVPTFGTSVLTAPASSAGLMLGTSVPTTSSTGFGFSIPTSTKLGPSFSSSAATTGLNFNIAAPIPSSSIPTTGLTFATTLTAPNTNLSFGTTSAVSSSMPTSGTVALLATTSLNFSAPASSVGTAGLTFGTPTNLTFGISTPTVTSAPSFTTAVTSGSGLSFTASLPSSTATVLNFGSSTTTKTAANTATVTTSALPLNLGVTPGPKLPAATTSFSLLAQPSTTASTTTVSASQRSVGLGGISATPPKQPPGGTNVANEQVEVAPKDQVFPNELLQTVENFKKHVQEQKSFSSEIARFSIKELKKVEGDIDLVNNCINEMESELQKNKAVVEKLKYDTAKGLQHAEMAQRTFDTPSGLQYDNTAPLNYFMELCDNFEKDMYTLKVHIENIDKFVRNTGPPTTLTSQDLALGMRRLHETFVALAGRLQSVHNQVELQKEQYLNLRKQQLNDYANVFESRSKELEALEVALDNIPYQPPTVLTGPTPFSSLGNSQAQALAQNPPPAYPGTTPLGVSAPGFNTTGPSTISLFGSNVGGTPSIFNTSSTAFQLQKPPIGNKRGKP